MRINSIPVVQMNRIELNQNLQKKPVSFGIGADEFVKTTQEKTFPEMKTEIQKKYQGEISGLRKELKELEENSRSSIENLVYDTKEKRIIMERFFRNRRSFVHSEEIQNKYDSAKEVKNTYKVLFKIMNDIYRLIGWNHERYYRGENLLIVSKDKKLAEDFLELSDFYTKISLITPMPEEYGKKEFLYFQSAKFRPNFMKVKDTFENNEDMIDGLAEILEKNKEQYDKTKLPSIINVENLDKLLLDSNGKSDIAELKNILSRTLPKFGCILTTATDKIDQFAVGVKTLNRFSPIIDIDKEGVTRFGMKVLSVSDKDKEVIGPAINQAIEIYRNTYNEYVRITTRIEELQKQCKKEIKQIDKSKCKKVTEKINNPPEIPAVINQGNGNNGTLKKILIATGVISTAILAIKNSGILKNQKKEQNKQPKNLNQKQFNSINYNTSSVFKNFA